MTSTWVIDTNLNWWQRFACNVIKIGPIPNHVAFIMDGNRRYAKKLNLLQSTEGHVKGFDKLAIALNWCADLGIKEITVYAFSIENFKRSAHEVNTLMELAREKFGRILEEKDKLNEQGICIRVIGNLKLLPLDLQKAIAKAILQTQHNTKAILNMAFAYTARDEISNAMMTLLQAVENREIECGDINEQLIRLCMYSRHSTDPDLLIRTSGESRLSDFLLWQVSSTVIHFTDILWPEFTIWHLLGSIFYYQKHYKTLNGVKLCLDKYSDKPDVFGENVRIFLEKFEKRKNEELLDLIINDTCTDEERGRGCQYSDKEN